MMPDLGSYAGAVLSAYAITLVVLIACIALSIVQSRRAKTALEEAETRRNAKTPGKSNG